MTTEVTKSLTPTQVGVMNFTKSINSSYVQNQLKQVLGKNAGTFATSLVEVFTNDTQLQKCDQKKVIQEAIKAATLKLPLNKQLGYAYILVFNNWDKASRKSVPTPQIVLGYRGYIQLTMRTGQYKNINADVVYEGEMVGRDKLSGAIDLSGDKISEKVVGYFAHFETVNGFSKTLFMSLGEMAGYALKFSPSFKRNAEKNPLPTVDALCDMANDQAVNGPQQGKVGWEGDFNSMAIKTVLRRLLSKYGYLSIEMMSALAEDESSAAEQRNEENNETKPVFDAQAVEIKEEESKPVEDCPI